MPEITIKGYDYSIQPVKNSFSRRAQQFTNSIIEQFKKIGLTADDIEISEERMALKKAPAHVSWWMYDQHCNFTYNKMDKFVDNLLVVLKVIENYVSLAVAEKISIEEFMETFKEDDNIDEQRQAARTFFELEENHIDLETINKKYKELAKTLHPDMPTGDIHKFKELNTHHKTLKRELE